MVQSASTVVTGDFNGDGIPDLAFVGPLVTVMLGDGTGNYTMATGSPFNAGDGSLSGQFSVLVQDFNGDGIPDLLVGVNGGVSIFLGNGNGTFTAATGSPIAISGFQVYSTPLVAGDFNFCPGISYFAAFTTQGVIVCLGNGDGTFKTAIQTGSGISGGFVSATVG